MMICPFCKAENIDGVDECEHCQQPLEFLSKPRAGSLIEHSILKDRVFKLGPRKPLTVSPRTTVAEVLRLMVARAVGCVIVGDEQTLVGIFTERDALVKLNVDVEALGHHPVSEFMTASPETIAHDAPIAFALHKMDIGGYRHIPVLTDGKPTGVISVRDILRYIAEDLGSRMV
jgi:CBS domain-containing protein